MALLVTDKSSEEKTKADYFQELFLYSTNDHTVK